ncbi:MAG: polyprenyl synthetase family protein [Desulfobulbaceae bacterium]
MDTADQSALRTFVGREALLVEQAMQGDLAEALGGCDPLLVEVINYGLFGGGKRLRPLLAILAARLCGAAGDSLYHLAAAFEYLHVATLIHDDVIDSAGTRRGREAVGRRYGMAPAILAGDWLHARSLYLVGRFVGPEGLAVFCRATTGMVDGEFLQLRHVADSALTEDDYFAIILRKTALLISSTCEIGAIFAGATPEARRALAEYGSKLGTAFQVIDDLLDYQGDAGNTGKQIGNDFSEGKLTLPLLRALVRAEAPARAAIIALLAGERGDMNSLATVRRFIEEHGGFDSARETAVQLTTEAVAALNPFAGQADRESLAMLHALAGYVLARNK